MDDHNAPSLHHYFACLRQAGKSAIVVAPHCLDRGDPGELVERRCAIHVTGVDDQTHTSHDLDDSLRKRLDEFRAVCVRDDAHKCGQAVPASTTAGRMVRSTMRGLRLSAAAMPKTASWPAVNATPPMMGPI